MGFLHVDSLCKSYFRLSFMIWHCHDSLQLHVHHGRFYIEHSISFPKKCICFSFLLACFHFISSLDDSIVYSRNVSLEKISLSSASLFTEIDQARGFELLFWYLHTFTFSDIGQLNNTVIRSMLIIAQLKMFLENVQFNQAALLHYNWTYCLTAGLPYRYQTHSSHMSNFNQFCQKKTYSPADRIGIMCSEYCIAGNFRQEFNFSTFVKQFFD